MKTEVLLIKSLVVILITSLIMYATTGESKPHKPKAILESTEPQSEEFIKVLKEMQGLYLAPDSYFSLNSENIPDYVRFYIKKFYKTAQTESQFSQQPASVKLAQGIVESSWGNSELSTKHNNHFGIKCFKKDCKPGHCVVYDDDKPTDRFKTYKSAWFSYRDHTRFVKKERYSNCKGDYKEWCNCLQENGYATNEKYTDLLLAVIRDYKLYQFDL